MGMMRRVGIVAAWVVATMVATMIAASAVGSVRGQVTDVPAIPNAGTAALLAATTTTAVAESSTTTSTAPAIDPTTTTTAAVTPTSSTTTTTTTPSSTPTTTAPPPTTTTTVPPGPAITTYTLVGGQVWISADEPDVAFVNAVPKAGFSVEVEKSGPKEVEVKFESADHQSEFRAGWKDGELDIDIDEESEEDD